MIDRGFFKKRRQLGARRDVSSLVLEKLLPWLNVPTLSFASFDEEIDMSKVNQYLFDRNLLILPRISKQSLSLHHIVGELEQRGKLLEPPSSFPKATPELILVPGLAFDLLGARIGYGKGYYDRLLENSSVPTIGIAYEEQLYRHIPTKPHDQKVDQLFLF